MSDLSLLSLIACHMSELFQQSANVPLVCSACGKLVSVDFS